MLVCPTPSMIVGFRLPVFKKAVEENYQTAKKYVDYEQNIVDYITKVFTENGIL